MFTSIFKSFRKEQLFLFVPLIVLFEIASFFLSPLATEYFLRTVDEPAAVIKSSIENSRAQLEVLSPVMNLLPNSKLKYVSSGYISLDNFENSFNISESTHVAVEFTPLKDDPKYYSKMQAKLNSPDFEISETNHTKLSAKESKYQWSWLVSPKKTGERGFFIKFEPPTIIKLRGANSNIKIMSESEGVVFIPVTVRTELGFTALQDALAKVVAGILTLIATILGLTFIQSLVLTFIQRFITKSPSPSA